MDCSEAGAMLDELALGVLPGDQRAALLHHLEQCPACWRLLDELSESADALLLAAPVAAPPPGFGDRVLERIDDTRAASGGRSPAPAGNGRAAAARRAAHRRMFAAAAAVVALLAVGGVAGARLGGSGDNGHDFHTVRLISATGGDIGDVSTYAGPPAWFFMRLEGNLRNGTYQCLLDTDDGRTVAIGSLWAHDGRGAWGEHVRVDPGHVKVARLVDSDGTTVARARIS